MHFMSKQVTSKQVRIVCVVGTRPEAIKMAPVISALRESDWAECVVVATAQHRGLLDQTLDRFGIVPQVDLDLMTEGQTLAELTGRIIPALSAAIADLQPQAILSQGDTATVFCAALAAYYAAIPFGHVEAGLRTHDLREPFPEEGFRQMAARITRWHFAPTESAAANLRNEGIAENGISVTGNTGIDALMSVAAQVGKDSEGNAGGRRLVLLTAHRRESFGAPMRNIFLAVRRLVDSFPDIEVLCPVHPNPNVKAMAHEVMGGHARIGLCEPLDYFRFVEAMSRSHFILTDSGGIQEEAPALGKPVLVLREQTERPEALAVGVARLVGTDSERIFAEAARLLDDPEHYQRMSAGGSPYGDGHSAPRIVRILRESIGG
jgi:UDP-N-acetylglucosamine 2-epimerase (non-hydrolysing)